MKHAELINNIIKSKGYKTYLEIGTWYGDNFDHIDIEQKECCDPNPYYSNLTYKMTSDELFATLPIDKKYDIIFIDGMHLEEYVDRDILNSLKHINKNGIICIHDTIPYHKYATNPYYYDTIGLYDTKNIKSRYEDSFDGGVWNGTVWKSIPKLHNYGIEFYTIHNDDFGLTIVKPSDNPYILTLPDKSLMKYENVFNDNYKYDEEGHVTKFGKFVMHIINENEIDNVI